MPQPDDRELQVALHLSLQEDLGALPEPGLEQALLGMVAMEGPGAGPDRLARMLAAVRQAQDVEAARNPVPESTVVTGRSVWLAVQAQVRVVRLPLIAAAVLVLLLGIAFGPLWLQPICTPLLALAPPIAVLGVGYAFRSLDGGMSELERACPVRPVELALSRLIVVVGSDIVLSLLMLPFNAGHALLGGVGAGLLLDWLAPLLLASGVSLLVIQRFGSVLAVEAGMIIWLGYIALHVLVQRQVISLGETAGILLWLCSIVVGLGCFAAGVIWFDRSGLQGARA